MTKIVCNRPMYPDRTGIKIVGQSSSLVFVSFRLGYFAIHIPFSKLVSNSLISLINLIKNTTLELSVRSNGLPLHNPSKLIHFPFQMLQNCVELTPSTFLRVCSAPQIRISLWQCKPFGSRIHHSV